VFITIFFISVEVLLFINVQIKYVCANTHKVNTATIRRQCHLMYKDTTIVVICGTGQMRPDNRGDPNSMTDFLYFILYGTHL